jgi:hypothetical protein
MMPLYEPRVGERYLVTLEGEVSEAASAHFTIGKPPHGSVIYPAADHVREIVPVLGPTMLFSAGDVVARKHDGQILTLGKGGYLDHNDGQWHPCSWCRFDSDDFERLDLRSGT